MCSFARHFNQNHAHRFNISLCYWVGGRDVMEAYWHRFFCLFLLFVNTSAVASCLQKRVQSVTDADDTSVNKGDDVDSNDDDYDGNDMIEEIHYNTL